METLGLETVAGAKLLQLKFGRSGAFQPGQAVMHGDRRARFIRVKDGAAIIQHWGDSHAVSVSLESLSVPPEKPRSLVSAAAASRPPVARAEMRRGPRPRPRLRPALRP
jgi:hypothetical protein